MKSVFSNEMTAHVWAQNNQDTGRTSNGNFYFTGATLYSYGSHFVVGHHLPSGPWGKGPTLITGDGYSITTSGHIRMAESALNYRDYLTVPGLTKLVAALYRCNGPRDMRKPIRDFVTESMTGSITGSYESRLSDDAAQALLAYVGLAKSFPTIKRKGESVAAKRKADAIKAAKQEARETLTAWAQLESKLFETLQNNLVRLGDYHTAANMIERETKQIRSAQRQLGKAGTPVKLWAASQRILKALGAMEGPLEAGRGMASRHARLRGILVAHRRDMDRLPELWTEAATAATATSLNNLTSHLNNMQHTMVTLTRHTSGGLPEPMRLKAQESIKLLAELQQEIRPVYYEILQVENVERDRLRAQSQAESRAAWFAGEPSSWSGSTDAQTAYVRAVDVRRNEAGAVTGGELQTSHGARVPLVQAIRIFRFVKLVKETGQAWQRNGERARVGSFELDWIDASGNFKAGCHMINWPEIESTATALGVFELPASRDAVTHV